MIVLWLLEKKFDIIKMQFFIGSSLWKCLREIILRRVKEKGITEYIMAFEDQIIYFDYLEEPDKIRL